MDAEELSSFLTTVYTVLVAINPAVLSGRSPAGVAAETAAEALASAGRDGALSFEEFKRWYEARLA